MALEDLSDDDLVAEYKRREAGARDEVANELFGRHYQRVARWCFRVTNDREAAADLAQDVFLKAHRHLHSFQGMARFTTWLYAIVRNESLNRLKREPPPSEDEDALVEIAALAPSPEDETVRQRQAVKIRELLTSTLDPTERSVFTLHYGDEISLDAITRMLGLRNASGAKAYIVSARRKLARAAQRLQARGELP